MESCGIKRCLVGIYPASTTGQHSLIFRNLAHFLNLRVYSWGRKLKSVTTSVLPFRDELSGPSPLLIEVSTTLWLIWRLQGNAQRSFQIEYVRRNEKYDQLFENVYVFVQWLYLRLITLTVCQYKYLKVLQPLYHMWLYQNVIKFNNNKNTYWGFALDNSKSYTYVK